jgi:tRNA A-37 threonylcarbamoyl transferase component Bud32
MILEIPGEIIKKSRPHKPKTTLRIRIGNSCFYLKTRWEIGIKNGLKDFIRGSWPGCREAKNYIILQKLGFKTPSLIAYGFTKSKSYQITKELEGAYTVRHSHNEKNTEDLIKEIGSLICLLHQKNFIYGDFSSDNILVLNTNNKNELFLIDPVGLKKSSSIDKKSSDLANFLVKNGKIWVNDDAANLFLDNYLNLYSKTKSKILNHKDFRKIIDRKIKEKITNRSLYGKQESNQS